jgi:2-polyprenyl-3-methyl-5-hydroxy-6-metoxy-1,4-benzoquinol methylase
MQENLAFSGESYEYFLEHKVVCLQRLGLQRDTAILDYGCGIGNLTRCLAAHFERVEGYDPSAKSIEIATRRAPASKFHHAPETIPDAQFGAVVLSGVLHHVLPHERLDVLGTVKTKLVPGGQLVIFEHNPLNPLTRRAVRTCPWDEDAELLWPRALRALAVQAGFVDVRLRYILFFPRLLQVLRPLEPYLGHCFAGAQTMTTGTRP